MNDLRYLFLIVICLLSLSVSVYCYFLITKNPHIQNHNLDTSIIQSIQSKLEFNTTKISDHDNDLLDLWSDVYDISSELSKHNSIVLDTTTKDYQRLDTSTGFFLISVEDVKPFLDGYKIKLKIGNPLFASFNGFTVIIKYGMTLEKYKSKLSEQDKVGIKYYLDWLKSLHTIKKEFTDKLEPATWNNVELIIKPVVAEELGYIEMSMGVNIVALN